MWIDLGVDKSVPIGGMCEILYVYIVRVVCTVCLYVCVFIPACFNMCCYEFMWCVLCICVCAVYAMPVLCMCVCMSVHVHVCVVYILLYEHLSLYDVVCVCECVSVKCI